MIWFDLVLWHINHCSLFNTKSPIYLSIYLSRRQHPTRHQLYGHLPPITKTIQVRRTRHAGHCWRSKDELISDVLLWTPTYGRGKAGRPARTYIQQICGDTVCRPEDLSEAMNDREKWREGVRDIRASSIHDDDDILNMYKLVQLYDISTILGHLMPNHLYTYILII